MPSEKACAALISESGLVENVIVIPYCNDDDAEITAYCNGIGLPGTWIDTSITGARRRRFAGIGMTYDAARDAFIEEQPYPSWTLNADGDWQPPTPKPTDDGIYFWSESDQEWKPVTV